MTQDAYQQSTVIDNTPIDSSVFGYLTWKQLHDDHNISQVDRFKKLCQLLNTPYKESITLKDVNDLLELAIVYNYKP